MSTQYSKWAVEATDRIKKDVYAQPDKEPAEWMLDAIQSAIDAACSQRDKEIARLQGQLKLHKEAQEANAHQCWVYENALIGAKQYDMSFDVNIHEKTV